MAESLTDAQIRSQRRKNRRHNMDNKKTVIVTLGGGYSTTRKEASVRFVSDDLRERRSEVRLIESEVSYG